PEGDEKVTLDPADFSTKIDNTYWPMVPGTQATFRGVDGEGSVSKITVTVTNQTKKVANGVTARVVRDTVYEDGQITEDTIDWFAQDKAGVIWYLGEDTATYKDGKVESREGSWEAGVDGAQAGVALPADAKRGPVYRQEYYRGHAEDNGQVLSGHEMVDVKYGHFGSVLLTRDTTAIEPNALEYKFYAPGVGPILTLDISGGSDREELVKVDRVPDGTATGPLGNP
ncbi:MAG: hypothetical protein ABIR57_14845, partial [Aeromicrobium sp.]